MLAAKHLASQTQDRMVRSLRLMNFRCFAGLSLELPDEGGIFVGDNAQGKTSILEALCVLTRLHSPRSHRMANLVRVGFRQSGIAGSAWDQERRVDFGKDGLELKVDGEARQSRSAYLADGGLVVWMGNEDLELVRGSGEVRRHYLDFLGGQLDLGYRRSLSRYKVALRAKNLLLKEARPNDAEIVSYEEILIEHGMELMASRARLIHDLGPLVARAQEQISGKHELLELAYRPASGSDMRQSLQQARERERRLRQSVVGPHRDDVILHLNGMAAADFASEGQQRTLALALKLAQGELLQQLGNRLPIYLMDDIFGELDPMRRNALMAHLPDKAQKWITTTTLDWLKETPTTSELRRFAVASGEVK
jgi:DNA replication and repair protein RecF